MTTLTFSKELAGERYLLPLFDHVHCAPTDMTPLHGRIVNRWFHKSLALVSSLISELPRSRKKRRQGRRKKVEIIVLLGVEFTVCVSG